MPDPYVGSIEPPIAIVVSITRAVALPAIAAHLGRFLPRLRPLVATQAALFVCTHMELHRGLVDLYLGRVTSYPRAMATTKRSVLPDDTERTATEPAREQAVAGQGRPRNARPVFPITSRMLPVITVYFHDCGEPPMISIADLLIRFRQGSRPASNAQVAVVADRDRSSMAEFVRILQAYDQGRYGRS